MDSTRNSRRHRSSVVPSPASELAAALHPYLLSQQQLWSMGYPCQVDSSCTKAAVYIHPFPRRKPLQFTAWNVNAAEFVPRGSPADSGRGSWCSTPRSGSDSEVDAVEHLCVRCDKLFLMTLSGEYLVEDPCSYHWGRLGRDGRYTCCEALIGSGGCNTGRYHVWSGTRPGMNGPIEGYVRARSPRGGVYAIDAEMCYTTAGLELASIAVTAADGGLVYTSLVKPSAPIVDCNTRFSGISLHDLKHATKTLRDVQHDILRFVGTDTILVGHALDNDLRALRLLHNAVIDTCALYPHPRGFPMRRSLRALAEELLGRSVQQGSAGHSPYEDAQTAMDLVLLKVREDHRSSAR